MAYNNLHIYDSLDAKALDPNQSEAGEIFIVHTEGTYHFMVKQDDGTLGFGLGGSAGFDITTLMQTGKVGIAYDFTDLTMMFSDISALNPVDAIGDQVKSIKGYHGDALGYPHLEGGSGITVHAKGITKESGSTQTFYTTNNNWSDGSSSITNSIGINSGEYGACFGVRSNFGGTNALSVIQFSSSSNQNQFYKYPALGATGQCNGEIGDCGSKLIGDIDMVDDDVYTNIVLALDSKTNGSAVYAYIDGVPQASYTGVGPNAGYRYYNGCTIGMDNSQVLSKAFIFNTEPTAEDIEHVNLWLSMEEPIDPAPVSASDWSFGLSDADAQVFGADGSMDYSGVKLNTATFVTSTIGRGEIATEDGVGAVLASGTHTTGTGVTGVVTYEMVIDLPSSSAGAGYAQLLTTLAELSSGWSAFVTCALDRNSQTISVSGGVTGGTPVTLHTTESAGTSLRFGVALDYDNDIITFTRQDGAVFTVSDGTAIPDSMILFVQGQSVTMPLTYACSATILVDSEDFVLTHPTGSVALGEILVPEA
jgi:hypothetical protein